MSTPAVRVHGAAVAASKPPLTMRFVVPPEGFTVRLMVVVWVRVPDVPVIVIVLVPVVADALAVKVSTLVEVVGLVPNVAVTPLGRAELESVTDPVKPPEGVTVMVLFPLVPWVTLKLAGEADSVKFGAAGALIVRLTEVVCVSVPFTPVMVIVLGGIVGTIVVALFLPIIELLRTAGLGG